MSHPSSHPRFSCSSRSLCSLRSLYSLRALRSFVVGSVLWGALINPAATAYAAVNGSNAHFGASTQSTQAHEGAAQQTDRQTPKQLAKKDKSADKNKNAGNAQNPDEKDGKQEERLRTLVLTIEPRRGADAELAKIITDIVTSAYIDDTRRNVIGANEVRSLVNLEAEKQLAGCQNENTEELCANDYLQALDADRVIVGTLDQVGTSYLLTLSELDSKNASILAREQATLSSNNEKMLDQTIDVAGRLAATKTISGDQNTAGGPPPDEVLVLLVEGIERVRRLNRPDLPPLPESPEKQAQRLTKIAEKIDKQKKADNGEKHNIYNNPALKGGVPKRLADALAGKDVNFGKRATRQFAPFDVEAVRTKNINDALKENAPALRTCSDERGAVRVTWQVDQKGSASNIHIVSQQWTKTEAASCIVGIVEKIHFPEHLEAKPYSVERTLIVGKKKKDL